MGLNSFGRKFDPLGKRLGFYGSPQAGPYDTFDQSNPNYANDGLAYLTRARYDDWNRRFRQLEDQQIDYATDQTKPLTEGFEAAAQVQGSFDRIAGQQGRRNARQGVTLAPDQAQSQERATKIAGGLASVTAANRAAQQTYDRQSEIFSGGRSSIGGLSGAGG